MRKVSTTKTKITAAPKTNALDRAIGETKLRSPLDTAIQATGLKVVPKRGKQPESAQPEKELPKQKPGERRCTCKHTHAEHSHKDPVGCRVCNCLAFWPQALQLARKAS